MGHRKRKELFYNMLLMALIVIIMLIFIEVVIRIFFPQNLNYTGFDETLMYSHIANFETRHFRQEFSQNIKFNSKGLRDYEYSYEKPDNPYRILLLGASFSEALQVDLNETYENVIEKKLNERLNGRYEIINAAVGGYSTAQKYLFLRTEGLKYHPDMILLEVSIRSILDDSISPLISLKNGKLIENIPVRASLPKKAMLFCSRYLQLCSWVQKTVLDESKKNIIFTSFLGKLGLSSRGSSIKKNPYSIDMFYKKDGAELNKTMEKTFLLIKEIKEISENNNMELVILVIPDKEQVDKGKYREMVKKYDLDEYDLEADKMQKLFSEFAKENNLTSLNVLPHFKKRNINNTFYFDIDGHLNRQGHKLASELLYDFIKGRLK